MADHENSRIGERVHPPEPIDDCVEKKRAVWYHPCCMCLHVTRCQNLYRVPNSLSRLRFCGRCITQAAQYFQNRNTASSRSLFNRLVSAVKGDFKQLYGSRLDSALISKQASTVKKVWQELLPKAIRQSSEQGSLIIGWRDALANDDCGDTVDGNVINSNLSVVANIL